MTPIVVGLAAGALGAMLPGPLSLALVERAKKGLSLRDRARGLGTPMVHLLTCIAVGLAAGPLLRALGGSPVTRFALAASYVVFAVALVARELRQGGWRPPGGITLALKWCLIVGFVSTCGLVESTLGAALFFAAGVWGGAGLWFMLLALLGPRVRAWGVERCFRGLAFATAALLIALGLFTGRDFAQSSQTSALNPPTASTP